MFVLTPAERRGAQVVVLLLVLGAADDLWRAAHPHLAPAPKEVLIASPGDADTSSGSNPPAAAATRSSDTLRVDLNRADANELDRLPGIGPVLARRIVEHRVRHGRFARSEELLDVQGIGPRLFARLRSRVSP